MCGINVRRYNVNVDKYVSLLPQSSWEIQRHNSIHIEEVMCRLSTIIVTPIYLFSTSIHHSCPLVSCYCHVETKISTMCVALPDIYIHKYSMGSLQSYCCQMSIKA